MLIALGLVPMGDPATPLLQDLLGLDPAPPAYAVMREPVAEPLRRYCFSTRCGDEEWQRTSPASHTASTGTTSPAPQARASRLPGRRNTLPVHAPPSARASTSGYSNAFRIGTRYGIEVLPDGPTRLGLQFGAGYRLAPLHDDGIGATGPVLRGQLDLRQPLGPRVQWSQRIEWEAGRHDTFVKQSLGLDVALWPAWMLETDYVIRHDSRGGSGSGGASAESWLGLRRWF